MPEVQDIFLMHGNEYRQKHKLPVHILKAMSAIERCRTADLGGHKDVCNECGHTRISYNSCRNRHCPKCQTLSKERWIDSQKNNLLNVGYFHVVFTIPDTLNTLVFQNQKELYTLLFKVVAETLQELASDKKYLGTTLGFTSILHTWGQNLMHHPHLHCIVPGGGLNSFGKWVSSRKKFFLPVKVLSLSLGASFCIILSKLILNSMESKIIYRTQPFSTISFLSFVIRNGLFTASRLLKTPLLLSNISEVIRTELPYPTIVF